MIKLHSVSKTIGPKRFERTIAKNVTWMIEPRSKTIILSHQRAALSVLANIIAGTSIPTEGWVERQGKVCPPGGFLRYFRTGSPKEMIELLAPLYRFDPQEVMNTVSTAIQYDGLMRTQLNQLPLLLKRELNMAVSYAIPCDYYVFDGTPAVGRPQFRAFCRRALVQRSKEAGVIIATHAENVAMTLGSAASAAILYRGGFSVYQRLDDALAVFRQLQPEPAIPNEALESENNEPEEDILL